jgi:hypothetical protein
MGNPESLESVEVREVNEEILLSPTSNEHDSNDSSIVEDVQIIEMSQSRFKNPNSA